MHSPLIISVSGLRGVVGDSLTPDVVVRYVAAFAAEMPPGPIMLTYDGRTTGPMLHAAAQAALAAAGRDVLGADILDFGVAATPTVGVLVRKEQAAGGVQISASHNPPEYNGVKLFNAEGRVLPAEVGLRVLERYRNDAPVWAPYDRIGTIVWLPATADEHLNQVLALVDVDRIRRRKFRVLLDANHGSGAVLGHSLLYSLGCERLVLGAEPNGRFLHPPEPTAENLQDVCDEVKQFGADIGFCQDPDADRLAVIDADGRYLGEEYTPALCIDHVLRQRVGPVVMNCSSSRMAQDVAQRHGAPFFHAAVGEANVCDLMIAKQAVIGGEGNGGVIDPRVGYVRDSFVGMALLLDAMAARDMTIRQLADELPRYEIVKTKVVFPTERLAAGFAAIEAALPDAQFSRQDGLRLDWSDRWMLIRASNTEPIVRIIAEAPTAATAAELCERAAAALATV